LDDVAEYVGLSKAALYNLRHLGRGPVGYRVGRHLRFRLADVEAWLEATRDQPSVVA
jgi:excisionase family DNA binding protein